MAEINWNLLQPVDTGAQVQQGFQTGMAMVKQVQRNGALSAYLANPDDPSAYSALAYIDPASAATIQNQRLQQRKVMLDQQDRQRAVSLGELYNADPSAARKEAIGAGDFDLVKTFDTLDEVSQKKTAAVWQQIGPVAYQLKQTKDPEARRALWAEAKPMLAAQGADPAILDKVDPTNDTQLEAAITTAQKITDLISQDKPEYRSIEAGGALAVIQPGQQPHFIIQPNPGDQPTGGTVNPQPASSGGSRGQRNNNPLNLTQSSFTASQPGYQGTDSGGRYAKFDTPEAGLAAGQKLLQSYIARGFDTPVEIIGRWAPTQENGVASTANYINYVSQRAGISPTDPVAPDKIPAVLQAMVEFENGGRAGGSRRVTAAGGTPHVSSKAELDKLPSGTIYVAPDGSTRRKA